MTKTSLTEQSLYLIIGRCLAFLLTILHPIILVRVFTKEEYGLYAQLFLIAMTILPLGEMGTIQGLYYYLPRHPEKKNALMTQNMVFLIASGFMALVALLLFRSDIAAYFHNPQISKYIPIVGGYCFFMISSCFLEASMIADNKARIAAAITLIFQIAHSIILILTALLCRNIYSVMIAILFYSCGRFFFQSIYLKTQYQISLREIEYDFGKKILSFSIPFGLANIAFYFQNRLHSFVVSYFFNTTTFAIYSIGTLSLPFVGIITSSVANVMTPALSRCQKDGQTRAIHGIWNSAIRKMNLFLFPVFVFFFLTAPEFIEALFTIKYAESIPIFRISLLGVLLSSINCGVMFNAFSKTGFLLRVALLRLVSTLMVVYLFTKLWGVLGAVTAGFFISIVIICIEFTQVSKLLEVPYFGLIQWRVNTTIFVVAAIAGLSIVVLREFLAVKPIVFFGVSFLAYWACYVIFSMMSGIVRKEEIRLLRDYLASMINSLKSKRGII